MNPLFPHSNPTHAALERAPVPALQPQNGYPAEPGAGMDRRLTWLVIRRWKHTILSAAIAGVLAGVLVTVLIRPRWTVRGTLEVQDVNNDFLSTNEVTPLKQDTAASGYFSDIQTQIQIIQSDAILKRVAAELSAARNKEGKLDDATAHEIDRIRKKLKARAMGQTRIIELSVVTPDPQLAVDFLNLVCKDVIDQNVTSRIQVSQEVGNWLSQLVQKAQERLRSSESVLEQYAQSHDLVFTSDNKSVAEENLRQIQDELAKVQALRAEKQSRYEKSKSGRAASIPDVLSDSSLKQYEDQLTDLHRQRAELAAVYTPDYPKIKRLDAQIASIESALKNEEGDVLERIQNEYQQAERRQALLTSQYLQLSHAMSDVNQRSIEYDILKHEVDSNRQLYDSMLQRVKEATIASTIHPSNIHVIDRAAIPEDYSYPKPFLSCALGLGLFSFGAILFALVRERSDATLKQPGDASFLLNVPELGTVRHMSKRGALLSLPNRQLGNSGAKSVPPKFFGKRRFVSAKERAYVVAESFRSIATSILFSGSDSRPPHVVVVTSAGPGDGKTTVVANVGAALARSGRNVLLIAGDLRRNRLDEIFKLSNEVGLSMLLEHESMALRKVKEYVQRTSEPRLSVLTGGPAGHDTTHLLYSVVLPKLIEYLKQEYDMILIDTPPLLELSDARLLSRIADGVILVIRSRRTTVQAALAASQRLSFDRARVLGMVLNDWNPLDSLHGYYGYYGSKLA